MGLKKILKKLEATPIDKNNHKYVGPKSGKPFLPKCKDCGKESFANIHTTKNAKEMRSGFPWYGY